MQDDPEGHSPSRRRVTIAVDTYVRHHGRVYRIAQTLDFASVVGVDAETGRSTVLPIGELLPIDDHTETGEYADLSEVSDDDWKEAERRFAAIRPLVDRHVVGRPVVEEQAEETGVDAATLYRWLKLYRSAGTVLALVPKKRGWKAGRGRLDLFAERIVDEVVRDFYLTPQRPTAQKAVQEVFRRCGERAVEAPSAGAIRLRLNRIPERQRLFARGYKEKAKNRFLPAAGRFPGADYPLATIQIDHTPLDIILVDDSHRKPIGRLWLTLAIDVFSRMVAGYYLSFDPPSETSVAMCVGHAVLSKEEWLLLHKVDADWPVWGIPKKIHVDNAAEFRSDDLRQSCLAYGIHLEFRPVKQPRYGGHIERLLGTLLKEIHGLPGTTFSSIKDKEGYDPDKHAAMTKSEFEEWFVTYVCKVYHQRLHSGIGMSPRRKWEIGVFGNAETDGTGLPPRPADRLAVLLDFLPSFRRTIQTTGITIDGVRYYAEALRPWINAADPDAPGQKRQFVLRRDPRDISAVWFRDPASGHYFKIPFADQSLPPMSAWEFEQAKGTLRKEGVRSINEAQILRAVTELRSKVEEAKEKTKKARRQAQRRIEHEKKISPATPLAKPAVARQPPAPASSTLLLDDGVEPFEDFA